MTLDEWKRKYTPNSNNTVQTPVLSEKKQANAENALKKWQEKYMSNKTVRSVSSFDDLNNYFENSTKAVNSATDYYNTGTAGRRRASELEKIKENALKLDDFTEKKDTSASVMSVGGYMTREGSARSEYLKKHGYNSLKELENAIQKAQTSDKYDRSFGSEYEAELEDAYSGGQSALKFIEQNKDSFEDYDKLHAQLSDYLDGIKDLSDAMKGVRDASGRAKMSIRTVTALPRLLEKHLRAHGRV